MNQRIAKVARPTGLVKALLYARVSSKEQDKEGFSIPAQCKLLRDYALQQRFDIVQEFIDVETAKTTGRTNFTEMVKYLRKHPGIRSVLVEKTDRLYRNLKDWVTLDELDVEIHLAKEGVTLSRDSRSSEKFMHGIKVLMAKNYIDNLSEEARKGQMEKAEQGIWPTKAPLGYVNTTGKDGRKVIEPHPELAPVVTQLFERYATGQYSLKALAKAAHGDGLIYPKSGNPVPVSTVHMILRNRLYTGLFQWSGKLHQGKHEPLVSMELWERVQGVLTGRNAVPTHPIGNEFAFTGLMTCTECGCAVVAEIKKGKYVYYHCTGHTNKGRGGYGDCRRKYVREEVLDQAFANLLDRLHFDEEILEWVKAALMASHADERREHEQAIHRCQVEYKRLEDRLHAMYLDKLDGRIDNAFYDRMSAQWRTEQTRLLREIERHGSAEESYMEDGIRLLELARNASRLFAKQPVHEKKRLLNLVLSNCHWDQGKVHAIFRQPFDLLAETVASGTATGTQRTALSTGSPVWLGNLDSNQD
ncbi:recombinase family protein [Mesorhizobium sp. BH1-1-4]|uniref:recombinase family protein n=1 Tax=Mesorhizobium sp. BH1-1-4 TaxID=2876662 RepID=UPI001CD08557|nr:recombinase family protein [Mesorhizobium sp. BH1-1-4]MBZ9993160.1 recombinase family protein [Mesorhizobium sp. BH1-1-4]